MEEWPLAEGRVALERNQHAFGDLGFLARGKKNERTCAILQVDRDRLKVLGAEVGQTGSGLGGELGHQAHECGAILGIGEITDPDIKLRGVGFVVIGSAHS